jgi:hypothetical protein
LVVVERQPYVVLGVEGHPYVVLGVEGQVLGVEGQPDVVLVEGHPYVVLVSFWVESFVGLMVVFDSLYI